MAKLPEQIFKYVSSDRIDILEKLLIRFTQPSSFNDPFELRLPVDGHTPEKLDEAFEIVNRRKYRQYVLAGGMISYEEFGRIQNAYNQPNMDRLKLPPDCIKRVVVGCNMDSLNRK